MLRKEAAALVLLCVAWALFGGYSLGENWDKCLLSGANEFARNCFATVRSGDLGDACLSSSLSRSSRKDWALLSDLLRTEEPISITLVGCDPVIGIDDHYAWLHYVVSWRRREALVWIRVYDSCCGEWSIDSCSYRSVTSHGFPWDRYNRFSIGNCVMHLCVSRSVYMGPILAIASLMLSACALVRCLRARMRKKCLWIALILVGVGRLSVPWCYGSIEWQWMSIQVPVASWYRLTPTAPWVVSASVPIGALIFLLKMRMRRMKRRVVDVEPEFWEF